MENKETGKKVVTNEELMQKLEALESRINDIHDAVFLQLNTMQMYNIILQRFIKDGNIEKTLEERKRTFNVLISSSNEALWSMLSSKLRDFDKRKEETNYSDKYSLADELLKAIFG